MQDLTRLLREG
jgi:hypothetical protein